MKRKITKSGKAIKNRIEHWLPGAEERKEELESKVKNATHDRARRIMQCHADELNVQIDGCKRELDKVAT
jgi:hypothetical protein